MTLIPRAVIGKYDNGTTYGLKCSLPGFNALTDDDADPSKFSFNSEWTDIVKPHTIGIATFTAGSYIYFPELPYRPFYELRRMVGSVIYDDYFDSGSGKVGLSADISTNSIWLLDGYSGNVIYVVYKQATS